MLSWIFEKDIQTAEEEISVDGDIVLMRSKGRSLLDAGSGDNSNSINMNKDGEDGTASTYEERNLDAMEEDTWDSNPNGLGIKILQLLFHRELITRPRHIRVFRSNPEGMIQNGCNSGCETCPFQVDVESNKFKIGAFLAPTAASYERVHLHF